MKTLTTALSLLLSFCCAYSQSALVAEIRTLENAEREAFLEKDTTSLYQLFSPDLVVNAPINKIVTLVELKQLIRNGKVDLESFDRVTEKVTFTGDIAIAMGHETVRPDGKMPNAGKTVKRRYTNIWMKNYNSWQLVARQATIISIE